MRTPVAELTLEQFLVEYPRIAGAEDPPEGDPPAKTPPEEDPPADDVVTMPKAEADALRRKVAEGERLRRKAEADAKAAEEKRLAEEGKWKELADTRQRELDASNQRAAKLERERQVAAIAMRLKFRDVEDVMYRPSVQNASDDELETVLTGIAEARPDLVAQSDPPPMIGRVLDPSVAPNGGNGGGGEEPLTIERIKDMTTEELADLSPERYAEAQKVIAQQSIG